MNTVIETQGLSRRFGRVEAVKELTMAVPEGAIYAFLGQNGAGKTTTIKLMMGLIEPTGGTATILGMDSRKLGPSQFAEIGYVSENQQLPEWMTVRELVDFCRPMYPAWDPEFCAKMLRDFELPLDRRLRDLSRGMKMKASLLTSLAYRPRLLVLDEPFTGLDPLVRDDVVRGILELTAQEKWSVFISSHDLDEVERFADWVGLIDNGRLRISESTANLAARFRRIDCRVPDGTGLPSMIPDSWLLPEIKARSFHVIESEYSPGASERQLAALLPGSSDVTISDLSLRETFLGIARASRNHL